MIIKSVYDVLNHYLGQPDKKGNIRLPDEHEDLKCSIEKLVIKAYHSGKSSGKKEILEKVKNQTKELENITESEIFETIEFIKNVIPILDDVDDDDET